MRLRWTTPALRDMAEIHAFIAEHNPGAALKIARLLRAQAEGLTAHPFMGRAGRIKGTRELIIPEVMFIIAYRVTEATVDILAIRHGARVWPERMGE
jgi:addiction module RelE/StbE family toxin